MVEHIWTEHQLRAPHVYENKRCAICDVLLVIDHNRNARIIYRYMGRQLGYESIKDPGCTPSLVHLAKRYLDAKG